MSGASYFVSACATAQTPTKHPALWLRGGRRTRFASCTPSLQDKRASSSYLLWQDGKARVLIDSGGDSALRFGESGAQVTDLDVILFTHLHADHSADFPALIKSWFFEERARPLPMFRPAGNEFSRHGCQFEFLLIFCQAH